MATSLKIDDTLKSRVHHLASQRRRSPHWLMLEAIQQYVEREESRESFTSVRARAGAADQRPAGQARRLYLMWAVRRNQDRKAPDIARRQSWVRVVGSGSS